MNSLELQPTTEQIKRTYCSDTIGRNQGLHKFIELLNMINDSCVIALDGSWGSGKTFFIKQAKMVFDAFNPFITIYETDNDEAIKAVWNAAHNRTPVDLNPCVSVYYDAWENDNDDDPLLSIIYEILKSVDTDYSFKADIKLIEIAAAIAELLTGKKVHALIDAVKRDDPFAYIKSNRDMKETITEFFDSLLPEQGDRLIVYVDELDRCKPSFAVKLLERIKHYFSNDRIIFVLSVNSHELQNTVRQYYGNEFDACRYLDRFFDLRIELPPANMQRYYRCLAFEENSYVYDTVAFEVIRQYHFELREIAKYVRLIKIAAYVPTHDSNRYDFSFSEGTGNYFCLAMVVPIMIGLKMHNATQYKKFVEGKDSSPLIDIIGKGDIGTSLCKSLLGRKETYETNQDGNTIVSLSDKLNMVYDALFVQNYQSIYEINIGSASFNKETKMMLMQTASLLSGFANYS